MSPRWTLFFEPLDVLHFRDHRPFDAGEHFVARSIFPRPSVFFGCIRTALFRAAGADFSSRKESFGVSAAWAEELLGGPNRLGTLSLRGPILARYSHRRPFEPLLPCPRDLVPTEARALRVLRPWESSGPGDPSPQRFHWDGERLRLSEGPIPWTRADIAKPKEPSFLSPSGASMYLTSTPDTDIALTDNDCVPASQLFKVEPRVGIQRDADKLTAGDQMLYTTRPFRMADSVGFAVDVAVPSDKTVENAFRELHRQVVPLGGKAHRARVHVLEALPLFPAALEYRRREICGVIKLWFVTPFVLPGAPVEPGWLDAGARWVTGRADPVGGYDMAGRAPKALRSALPAGSIAYVAAEAAGAALDMLVFQRQNDDSKAGYGTVLVTALP